MGHADRKHLELRETMVPDVSMTMDEAERVAERVRSERQTALAQQEGAGVGNTPAAQTGQGD